MHLPPHPDSKQQAASILRRQKALSFKHTVMCGDKGHDLEVYLTLELSAVVAKSEFICRTFYQWCDNFAAPTCFWDGWHGNVT